MPLGYSTSQTCPTVVFPPCLFELIYFVKSIFSPQKINDETWRKSRKPHNMGFHMGKPRWGTCGRNM